MKVNKAMSGGGPVLAGLGWARACTLSWPRDNINNTNDNNNNYLDNHNNIIIMSNQSETPQFIKLVHQGARKVVLSWRTIDTNLNCFLVWHEIAPTKS